MFTKGELDKMENKFICLLATFDKETSRKMTEINRVLKAEGINGKQTSGLPHHITLAYFDCCKEHEIKHLLTDVSSRFKSFELTFNHIGVASA